MSVLKSLENRIAGLVEGTFSRAFRSEVRPVEVARRLAREMDANRVPLVSRVYVPFEYTVYFGEDDFDRFSASSNELVAELSAYLLEHARRERVVLPERPRIGLELDPRLGLGEFGIRTTPVEKSRIPGPDGNRRREPAPRQPTSAPVVPPPVPSPSVRPRSSRSGEARLVAGGTSVPLTPAGAVIGRSSSCEIRLEDPNASRRHAAVTRSGDGWQIEDLGSTNGVSVNGERIAAPRILRAGDRISLGQTELVFQQD